MLDLKLCNNFLLQTPSGINRREIAAFYAITTFLTNLIRNKRSEALIAESKPTINEEDKTECSEDKHRLKIHLRI